MAGPGSGAGGAGAADLFGCGLPRPAAGVRQQRPAVVLRTVEVEIQPDGRLTRPNAARYVGLSVSRLAQLASLGRGPKFFHLGGGRKTFYRRRDLDAWKAAHASW